MRICPHCNTLNKDEATTCVNCGAVLTKPILALICPKCGKVSPIGAKECPVCHEKLAEQNQQEIIVPVKKPKKKKSLWALLIVVILGGMFMLLGIKVSKIAPVVYQGYIGIEFIYKDHSKKVLYKDYYIVKQNDKSNQTKFSVAYAGRGNKGKTKVSLMERSKLMHSYKKYPHYLIEVKKNRTILTGPQQVILKVPQSAVIGPKNYEEKIMSTDCSCEMKNNRKIKRVEMSMISLR